MIQIQGLVRECRKCGQTKPLDQFYRVHKNEERRQSVCRVCQAAYLRKHYGWGPARRKGKPPPADVHLWNRYGITRVEWEQLREAQGGRCKLCGEIPQRFTVDHNHETGAVRGLLCFRCNGALGAFKDDPAMLRRAADYLDTNGGY